MLGCGLSRSDSFPLDFQNSILSTRCLATCERFNKIYTKNGDRKSLSTKPWHFMLRTFMWTLLFYVHKRIQKVSRGWNVTPEQMIYWSPQRFPLKINQPGVNRPIVKNLKCVWGLSQMEAKYRQRKKRWEAQTDRHADRETDNLDGWLVVWLTKSLHQLWSGIFKFINDSRCQSMIF